jgi:magnesium transporter
MIVKEKAQIDSLHHPLNTQTAQLDDILLEKLERAFHKTNSTLYLHHIAKIAKEHSTVDLSYAASHLPREDRIVLYENLETLDKKIVFLINTDENTRSTILRQIDDIELKSLLDAMPLDEAVNILEQLSTRRFHRIIQQFDVKKAAQIKELVKHEPKSAARLMTNEFFAFTEHKTIDEVANAIRKFKGISMTRRIFVINSKGALIGYVPGRNLIVNEPDLTLKEVMRPIYHKVLPDTPRDEVIDIVERYKISALPVADKKNHLLGVITYEDVLEAMADMTDETLALMAGTNEKVAEKQTGTKRFFARAPWLFVTLCAGLINMEVMQLYNDTTHHFLLFLLFFVPLITGLSGNIGLQSSTVLVRYIALGMLSKKNRKKMIAKELVLGVSTGLIFGVLTGFIVFSLNYFGIHHEMTNHPIAIGMIIGGGLTSACFAGAILGVMSPVLFANMGVDPAVASGPIITALNDFLSMVIYFVVATFLTGVLL